MLGFKMLQQSKNSDGLLKKIFMDFVATINELTFILYTSITYSLLLNVLIGIYPRATPKLYDSFT